MTQAQGYSSARLADLGSAAVPVLREAGRAIMRFYESGDIGLSAKPDDSPLTAADLAADVILHAGLAGLVPDCPVISEERAAEWPASRREGLRIFWLVDPLDGTREFVAHNGEFCVCVALVADGLPVLGLIHAPVTGLTYFAYRGAPGVQRCDAEDAVATLPTLESLDTAKPGLRVAMSRHHAGSETRAYLSRYREPVEVPMGSAIKFCAIAEGTLDLYPRFGPTMAWDTAAGQCILEIAGRRVLDAQTGEALRYDRASLTNPGFVAGL